MYFNPVIVNVIDKNSDGSIWIELDQTFFSVETNIYACFTYIPPQDSKYYKIAEMDPFETLESGVRRYSDLGEILVLGDLNARSADRKDFAMDIDIFDKYIDSVNGIDMFYSVQQLLPRASIDKEVNASGEKLLDLCKSSNLMICNGRMFNGADVGHFTFMSEKGCSLIDYALVTPNLVSQISGFSVRELFHNSPHSPIELSIRVNYQVMDKSKPKEYVKTLKWNNENNELFISGVSDKLPELDSITSRFCRQKLISIMVLRLLASYCPILLIAYMEHENKSILAFLAYIGQVRGLHMSALSPDSN